jgi:hypothetical protein
MSWIKRNELDVFNPVFGVTFLAACVFILAMSVFGCHVLTEIVFQKWNAGPLGGTLYVLFCLSIGGLTYYLGTKNSEGFIPAKTFFGFFGACAALLGPFGLTFAGFAWLNTWLDS